MKRKSLSLNGLWRADFLSDTPYTHEAEPNLCANSDSLTEIPVPGYWEDMTEQFPGLYKKLKINPLYEDQSYPQTGYCSDMFLPNPVGCLAYCKTFVLEELPVHAQLHFGGVQNTLSAWINGVYLGRHEGYSTPFFFSVPEGVLAVGENRITLAVSNNRLAGYMGRPVSGLTSRAANECTGGIYAPDAQFGNDAAWGNFTKVAGKVLIDGEEVSVVYGMAPDANSDSSWGASNAILLYITGEGYWDAVTTASSVTVCAGTMLVSGVDNTKGVKFAEDFTMYKNCDGSWDTTADTHVYNQQNTELEGALASEANCQSAAAYYYSCSCGQLGSETFYSGELGDHSFANGSCSVCGQAAQSITISFQTVTADGTWQLIPSAAPANTYYRASVVIDGSECEILVQYGSEMLLIYPGFFTALNGAVPTESFVIPAGTVMKAVDSANGWAEIENAAVLVVSEELKIENIYDKWYEMSKYADVTFTEVYAADLDMYYYNILRLGDYSDAQIAIAKLQYPEYADLIEYYGRDANMTTFGIKSTIPTLQIPNHDSWPNFQLIGKISVDGAEPWETYVMQTPSSAKEDSETAMDNAFLVRFYNDFVGDQAVSISIEPGTRIVTADGTAGFVFVDGYTLYRDSDGNWSEEAPEGTNPVNKWGLTLGDQIGVKFEVKAGMNVSFAVNGNAVDAVQNGNIYTIYLAAAQMNDVITVSVDGVAQEKTYSVRGYADIILNDEGYGEQTYNLVKTMLVYGGAAQSFFEYNDSKLASDGIEVTAAVPDGDGEIALSDDLKDFAFYGASLVYQNKIAVRIYFSGSTEGLTFTANGAKVNAVAKGELHYVEVSGINPQELGNDVEVVVTNGTDSLSVSYSPLDYMVRMYNKEDSSDATKTLVQALYGYYLAAVAYADK